MSAQQNADGDGTTNAPQQSGQAQDQGQEQSQDSPTLQRLRQRVRELNAQSEANAALKGGW